MRRFRHTGIHQQVDDELAFHAEMVVHELTSRGMSLAAAEAEAARRLWDVEEIKATCRDIAHKREREMRRAEYLDEMRHDVVYALRQLLNNPGLTLVAGLTLALGIGATTAIFSAVQSVVLRPFTYANPDRVMLVTEYWRDRDGNVSVGNYADWMEGNASFEALAAERFASVNLTEGDNPERVSAGRVTSNFFKVFGVEPLLGRWLVPDEDAAGEGQTVVLAHSLWASRFGSDRTVLGRRIRLSGLEYTIVGVMPPSFDPSLGGEQLWIPLGYTPADRAEYDRHYLSVFGLLKPGVSLEAAQRDLDVVMRRSLEAHPLENAGRGVRVQPLDTFVVGNFRDQLFFVLGAVGLVLLIACGNVANLLLARGSARAKEIAIRGALGAGRARIARQLLTESAVLALLASGVGLLVAWGGIQVLMAHAPPGIPRLEQTRIDGWVLGFTVLLALISSAVFGLVPAVRAARLDVQTTLREGGRSMRVSRDRVRTALVVGEVGLALALLVGSGLLIRSALHLRTVQPGFDPAGLVAARLALPASTYADAGHVTRTFQTVLERLRATPGVTAATVVSQAPLGGGGNENGLLPEGKAVEEANFILARLRIVTPGFFEAMRIPLERGRPFDDRDVAGAERVMIVSAALARQAWPGDDPIGKRIRCCEGTENDPRYKTVIGVAADVRSLGPTVDPRPEFYVPIEQVPPVAWEWIQRAMTLVARTDGDAAAASSALRESVKAVDPTLPIYAVATLSEALAQSTAQARFNMILLSTLGAIGLVLAVVGIYGVVGYFVSLRTHEIGVRMAMGAGSGDVVRLMARQGLTPILAGIALGTAGALAGTDVLRGALYGVTPTDPLTFVLVALLLVGTGLVATLIPASRATRVNPVRALDSA